MNENIRIAFSTGIYVFVVITMIHMCSNFLNAIEANSASQKRAAWAQVYWSRRQHSMAEKNWQEQWEALHAVDYCRQKLQEAELPKVSRQQR
jgi:hypothetical protein